MRAVVVYESMYGNTREVAQHIAEGLRATGSTVDVVHVNAATRELVRSADLLVVGGPTHVHGMTRPSTRNAAEEQAPAHDLPVEPGIDGGGLREWFETMPQGPPIEAAAFDTRVDAPKIFTGQASSGIRANLRRHGFRVIAPPESFFVDKHPRLLLGETERATAWGRTLAALTSAATAHG